MSVADAVPPPPGSAGAEGAGDPGLVSVAMATFDGGAFVAEQLRSLLAQEVSLRLEVVVSDDGSADGTVRICREMAAVDPRVRVLDPAPARLGAAGNFERAMRATRGALVALSDQDDVWDADKLAALVRALDAEPAAELAFCDMRVVDRDGRVIAPSYVRHQRLALRRPLTLRRLLFRNVVTGGALMVRRSLLRAALPLPAGCVYHDWWLAVVAATRAEPVFVPRALQSYRQHGGNMVGARPVGLSRFLPRLRASPAAAPPGTRSRDVVRLESYLGRSDVFATDASRGDVAFALAFFRDLDDAPSLGLGRRLDLLREWMEYRTCATFGERTIAVASTLAPSLSRGLARLIVWCSGARASGPAG